jgi:hypothetical protein
MGIAAVSRLTPVRDLGHKGEVHRAVTFSRRMGLYKPTLSKKKAATIVRHEQDHSREQINVENSPRRFLAGEY